MLPISARLPIAPIRRLETSNAPSPLPYRKRGSSPRNLAGFTFRGERLDVGSDEYEVSTTIPPAPCPSFLPVAP